MCEFLTLFITCVPLTSIIAIVGSEILTRCFMTTPLYCLSTSRCFYCLVFLAECVIKPYLKCYFANESWCVSTGSNLLCILCNKASFLLKFQADDLVFANTLIRYHTHRQTHTGHIGTIRLTHIYKYILTLSVMSTQQLPTCTKLNE